MPHTMNDSVSVFNIQCISGLRYSSELEIQTLWFHIPPESLNFSVYVQTDRV